MRSKVIHPSFKVIFLFFLTWSVPGSIIYTIIATTDSLSGVQIDMDLIYYIFIAFCGLEGVRRYFNDRYEFKKDKLTAVQGLISFHLTRNTIDYLDIREIKTNQSILGRILDYGDLLISTSSTSGIEITMKNIDDVETLNQEITKYKTSLVISATTGNKQQKSPTT